MGGVKYQLDWLAGPIAEQSNSSCGLGCGQGDPVLNPCKDGKVGENRIALFSYVMQKNSKYKELHARPSWPVTPRPNPGQPDRSTNEMTIELLSYFIKMYPCISYFENK